MIAPTPSGWADERMSAAYESVYAVMAGFPKGSEVHAALDAALDAIEHADEEIVNAGNDV